MSEDFTYCANWDCKVTRCRRNRANVKHRELMHGYAWLKGTEFCLDIPSKKEVIEIERTTQNSDGVYRAIRRTVL